MVAEAVDDVDGDCVLLMLRKSARKMELRRERVDKNEEYEDLQHKNKKRTEKDKKSKSTKSKKSTTTLTHQ